MWNNISPSRVAKSMEGKKKKNAGKMLSFFIKHPTAAFVILVTTIAIVIGFVIYLVYSANVQLDTVLTMYTSLNARPNNSKSNFGKKKFYITVDSQGISHVTIRLDTGFDTEYDEFGNPIEDDEDDNDSPGGYPGNGNGSTSDYTLDASDSEMLSIFKSIVNNEEKAYGLLACYKACKDVGMSSRDAIGLLACACCEGKPGLVQYTFYSGGIQSTSTNELFLTSVSQCDTYLSECYNLNIDKSRGIGTAQWTDTYDEDTERWSSRGYNYTELLKSTINQYGGSIDKRWLADYNMYKNELTSSCAILPAEIKYHDSSIESILVYSYFRYEAGFGNYKDSDSISTYSGTRHERRLNDRLAWATKIDSAFQNN